MCGYVLFLARSRVQLSPLKKHENAYLITHGSCSVVFYCERAESVMKHQIWGL